MKTIELKLLSRLLSDARKSDRQLAKEIGVSQPTVTRIRNKLEKEGYIREYAAIPNFPKIGFEVMAATFGGWKRALITEERKKFIEAARELDRKIGFPVIFVASGIGLEKDLLVISYHHSYSDYREFIDDLRRLPFSDMIDFHSFLVDLKGSHYHDLTFSSLADHLSRQIKKDE
jgi:Lrp/AsnC family transcriptional regulator for asnA, asnC and gidA